MNISLATFRGWCIFLTSLCILTITSLEGAAISGVIRDEWHNPIGNATVTVSNNSTIIAETTTENDGSYSISDLEAGTYLVRAAATSFLTTTIESTITTNQSTNIYFILQALPSSVSGQVVNAANNQPIANQSVEILLGSYPIAAAFTDENGFYELTNLIPGMYVIRVNAPYYQTAIQGVFLQPTVPAYLNFALQAGGNITGYVRDQNSNPIPGATIEASDWPKVLLTISGEDGGFSFEGLAPSTYRVVARAAYFSEMKAMVPVNPGETTLQSLTMSSLPGSLTGHVADKTTGQPIVNQSVELLVGNATIATAVTDGSGAYAFNEIPSNNYIIKVSSSNYLTTTKETTVLSGRAAIIDFDLELAGRIQGNVRDECCESIKGATITVLDGTTLIASTTTANDGSYSISDLPPGSYSIKASAACFLTTTVEMTVAAGTPASVFFCLQHLPGSIEGTVTNATTHQPINNQLVELLLGNVTVATALTNSNGTYTFTNLVPQSYVIRVSAESYEAVIHGVLVQSTITTYNNFLLSNSLTLAYGQINEIDTGMPVPGAKLDIWQGSILISSTSADSEGYYASASLAPGDYTLVANSNHYQCAIHNTTIHADEMTAVDMHLSSGAGGIGGLVLNECAAPLADALISLSQEGVAIATAVTDSVGEYRLEGLAPGCYQICASAPHHQDAVHTAAVYEMSATAQNIALKMYPGAIQGCIYDELSAGIANAVIDILKDTTALASVLTDANGCYSIQNLSEGDYLIRINSNGYQPKTEKIQIVSKQAAQLNAMLEAQSNYDTAEGF